MTVIFWAVPALLVKDTAPTRKHQKSPPSRGFSLTNRHKGHQKYDHAAIIADRLAGMSWREIARKYNVKNDHDGQRIRGLITNSQAAKRLKPKDSIRL